MFAKHRIALAALTAALLPALPAFSFDSPLSEEAVREAYFLGQRHDESMLSALAKYNQPLPLPSYGPYIASITYLTPFAQAVLLSSQKPANYSAQQAEADHRSHSELVRIQVAIRLTDSYGADLPSNSNSSQKDSGLIPRSSDFWRDFNIAVFDGKKLLKHTSVSGKPEYSCSSRGPCNLIGATVRLDFAAQDFTTQDVTVQIDPPEGDRVTSNFDLAQVR